MTTTPTTTPLGSLPDAPARTPRRRRVWLAPATRATAITLGVLLPALAGTYTVDLAATALLLATLALSTQLLVGVCGLPAFGQAAYYGAGAYTTALLTRAGVSSGLVHLPLAALAGAATAALSAPLVLRTRGTAFMMVTLAVQGLTATLAAHWSLLGGDEGLHTPPVTLPGVGALRDPAPVYWYALATVLVLAAGLAVALRSRLGLVLRGCAGHEPRMAAFGHRVGTELAAGYVTAGALAGVGGALLVAVNRYVSPADLGFDTAATALLAAAIGAGTMTGAAAGAVAIIATRDWLGGSTGGHGTALLGVLFLAVAYARPILRALRNRAPFIRTRPGRGWW